MPGGKIACRCSPANRNLKLIKQGYSDHDSADIVSHLRNALQQQKLIAVAQALSPIYAKRYSNKKLIAVARTNFLITQSVTATKKQQKAQLSIE